VPTARTCLVSFTESENIGHSVEVVASSLYEAAVLAIAEFRRCGFTTNAPAAGTRLSVAVKQPATMHEVQWGKVETWIQSAGKPNELAMKARLRELFAGLNCNSRFVSAYVVVSSYVMTAAALLPSVISRCTSSMRTASFG
jgi:hypothetical protein